MAINSRITFRHMRHNEALEGIIRGRVEKLERFYDRISSCEVIVEAPHRASNKGPQQYQVRIHMSVPGGEVVVERTPDVADYDQLQAAVRSAFDAARRQLRNHAERRRGD